MKCSVIAEITVDVFIGSVEVHAVMTSTVSRLTFVPLAVGDGLP